MRFSFSFALTRKDRTPVFPTLLVQVAEAKHLQSDQGLPTSFSSPPLSTSCTACQPSLQMLQNKKNKPEATLCLLPGSVAEMLSRGRKRPEEQKIQKLSAK